MYKPPNFQKCQVQRLHLQILFHQNIQWNPGWISISYKQVNHQNRQHVGTLIIFNFQSSTLYDPSRVKQPKIPYKGLDRVYCHHNNITKSNWMKILLDYRISRHQLFICTIRKRKLPVETLHDLIRTGISSSHYVVPLVSLLVVQSSTQL